MKMLVSMSFPCNSLVVDDLQTMLWRRFDNFASPRERVYFYSLFSSYLFASPKTFGSQLVGGAFTDQFHPPYMGSCAMETSAFGCLSCANSWSLSDQSEVSKPKWSVVLASTRNFSFFRMKNRTWYLPEDCLALAVDFAISPPTTFISIFHFVVGKLPFISNMSLTFTVG